MTFEHYIEKGGRPLRLGYTTGSCAALAAGAAVRMLLAGIAVDRGKLVTPSGMEVEVEILAAEIMDGSARCAVRKDGGDDPDATDGVLVCAAVKKTSGSGGTMGGGEGVGRITREGLDQPVGAAAINSVPRAMIERAVLAACAENAYGGGIEAIISIPGGEAVAERTFNPRLGIVGGLSVIGTSGIVEPMSDRAMIDAIQVELRMLRAEGVADLIITPGNYGEDFLKTLPELAQRRQVKCSNHIGETLDAAAQLGFARSLVVGHIGKLIKLAGGIMDTHSKVADCRLELLALHAALAGADAAMLRRVLAAATVDAGLDELDAADLLAAALAGVAERIDPYLAHRAGTALTAGAMFFSNRRGLLGVTAQGREILKAWKADIA